MNEKESMADRNCLRKSQPQRGERVQRGRTGDESSKIPFLDLFSGIGGFAIAFESEGFTSIGHAEVEPFACHVYHGHFPRSVCFGGVENVTRASVLERCGVLPVVVTGGFPCQPHSLAGQRKAGADERDLFGECKRVLGDIRPRFAVFENVAGLFTSKFYGADNKLASGLFFNRVMSDLAEIRFACFWQIVSAADVGAPHRRERIWLVCVNELADTGFDAGSAEQFQQRDEPAKEFAGLRQAADVADDDGQRGGELHKPVSNKPQYPPPPWSGGIYEWPAAFGHWPSRPGDRQYGWEPSRVILDDATRKQNHGKQKPGGLHADLDGTSSNVADTNRRHEAGRQPGCSETAGGRSHSQSGGPSSCAGQAEPALGGVSDGLSTAVGGDRAEVHQAGNSGCEQKVFPQVTNRVAQLKGYGNSIVPQAAIPFARAIRRQLEMTK